MPLQNRVTPLGELIADPARGLVYGNRGCLHDEGGRIRRRYAGKRWIACRLEFRGWRRRPLLQPGRFTELFFLDDATALAAGHRPCALCRREDYNRLVAFWRELHPGQVGADAIDDRLHALAIRFEDWQAVEVPTDMPTNERSTATSRSYSSPSTGRTAVVTFISGIPGSVSAHTPDVCYPGSGYKTLHATRKETAELPGGRSAEMYVADFEKRTATKQVRARVRWTWGVDATWIAPDYPRWQFATQLARVPVLFKVYIATPLPEEGDERVEDDPTARAFVAATLAQYSAAFAR